MPGNEFRNVNYNLSIEGKPHVELKQCVWAIDCVARGMNSNSDCFSWWIKQAKCTV